MRTDLPSSIQSTSQDLNPEAMVFLYKIQLSDNTLFYLSPKNQVTWQGNTYSEIPCSMADIARQADGPLSRPKFTFANPQGLFSSTIYRGGMDNAKVTRIRLLKSDLDANNNFSLQETYRVSRIVSLNKLMGVVELRDPLDSAHFVFPPRAFYPPEFPHVKIS